MMLRQAELRVGFEMALKTRTSVFARIHDELAASAAGLDVFAAGAVTGFTAALAHHGGSFVVNTRVRTGRKNPDVIRVTLETRAIADKRCARYRRWGHDRALQRRAGTQHQPPRPQSRQDQADKSCVLSKHGRLKNKRWIAVKDGFSWKPCAKSWRLNQLLCPRLRPPEADSKATGGRGSFTDIVGRLPPSGKPAAQQ